MAVYCAQCRTRLLQGGSCTTCGHMNPEVRDSEITTGSLPNSESGFDNRHTARVAAVDQAAPKSSATSSRIPLLATLSVLVIAGVAVAFFFLRGDDKAETISVSYTLEVMSDYRCDAYFLTGYSDVPFSSVLFVDGSGKLLTTTSLDGGTETGYSCRFSVVFASPRSTDGVYRISLENTSRGVLTYSEDDVVDNRLVIEAQLG